MTNARAVSTDMESALFLDWSHFLHASRVHLARKCSRKRSAPPLSDAEEAAIQAGIAADPDNPEWTPEDFALAGPLEEALPELARSLREGRERARSGQEVVTLGLDPDVVEHFKAGGDDWPARMNAALRRTMEAERTPA